MGEGNAKGAFGYDGGCGVGSAGVLEKQSRISRKTPPDLLKGELKAVFKDDPRSTVQRASHNSTLQSV